MVAWLSRPNKNSASAASNATFNSERNVSADSGGTVVDGAAVVVTAAVVEVVVTAVVVGGTEVVDVEVVGAEVEVMVGADVVVDVAGALESSLPPVARETTPTSKRIAPRAIRI